MLQGRHYRAAVIEHFWCAPYAPCLRPHCELLVLDLHNVESELARSHAQATRGLQSAAFSRFASAYRRLEREWLPHFDIILVASEEDRQRIGHRNVHVYPNALPEIARPSVREAACIVFSGNLEYHPNVEAVRWFHAQVWPRVRERLPGIEWRLVGRNAAAVAGLVAGSERVKVVGPVEDAIQALAEASGCVVPLRSGSGTRFKILEAWAAERAVVSTSIGAEGLGGKPGEHLLIADDPESFVEAIVRLMENPDRRRQLGESGRALYLDRYTWSSAWRALEAAGL
jgi:glycosyltransferase involved in cell wall biosynthesis